MNRVYPTEIYLFPHALTQFRCTWSIALPPRPCRCTCHHTIVRASHTHIHELMHLTYTCCAIQACTPPMGATASTTIHLYTSICTRFTLHETYMHASYRQYSEFQYYISKFSSTVVPNIDQYRLIVSHRAHHGPHCNTSIHGNWTMWYEDMIKLRCKCTQVHVCHALVLFYI